MNLQENINRIKEVMGIISESGSFDWDNANRVVTQDYSDEIYEYLVEMFPDAKEVIDYQYNDILGVPFAEWRRMIYDIGDYILVGPKWVDSDLIDLPQEVIDDRKQKYDDYISAKDRGEHIKYFRDDDSDPRDIDFNTLPPVTLKKVGNRYEANDGAHRIFLAKMKNKPIRSFIWVNKPNNHPNVKKIKDLFN